jgi:hypothetical protein
VIRRIFIDLDDVCNVFTMYALRVVGCPVRLDYSDYPAKCGYDIVAAANRLLGETRFTASSFWDAIPREVWATVLPSTLFPWLIHAAERLVGRENVCIATSPTKDPDCLAGKLEWIHCNMPSWMWRQYVVTPRKHLLARADSLLIDDYPENIQRFEQHGGICITVPRPWNCCCQCDPFEHVHRELCRLFPTTCTSVLRECHDAGCNDSVVVPA